MSEKKRDMSKLLALAAGSLALGAAQVDASALQDYSNLGRAAQLRTALYQGGDLVMQGHHCGGDGSCGGQGSCGSGQCGGNKCGSNSPHGGNCGSGWDENNNRGQGSCGQGTCGG